MRRSAIVTGAGSGIGRAVALALAADGYVVIATGRRLDALAETAALDVRGTITPIAADITNEASVAALFSDARRRLGRLDTLFNNAGVSLSRPFGEFELADWSRVIETNLTGSFMCARAAFRWMRDQEPVGGRIINNGSVSAHSPRPNSAAYTASKHAVTGLTKSIALEGRRHNIACCQIDIGNAGTEMTQRMSSGVPQANGELAAEPVFNVEDAAKTVLYMANLPLEANAMFVTLLATSMPFVGRG